MEASGRFLLPVGKRDGRSEDVMGNEELAERIWKESERMVGGVEEGKGFLEW